MVLFSLFRGRPNVSSRRVNCASTQQKDELSKAQTVAILRRRRRRRRKQKQRRKNKKRFRRARARSRVSLLLWSSSSLSLLQQRRAKAQRRRSRESFKKEKVFVVVKFAPDLEEGERKFWLKNNHLSLSLSSLLRFFFCSRFFFPVLLLSRVLFRAFFETWKTKR